MFEINIKAMLSQDVKIAQIIFITDETELPEFRIHHSMSRAPLYKFEIVGSNAVRANKLFLDVVSV